jgi:pilus assembly protein FimV
VRKLVKTLLSLLLVAPAAALALGVGEMQLNSALNQRLDAEIKLLSVDPAEADSIEVTLASYEDFAKVGLERPASLMFLRFDVEQRPGGDYFIKLGSIEPIRDPFLDFLIEVKWRSGRLLREYTLLLDPPLSYREASPAITAPTTTPVAATAPSAPEDEFVPPPSSIPVAPEVKAPATATFPDRMSPPAELPQGEIVYGPVKADDTLWAIALKLRPSSDVSVQQMMLALLKANPYAFFDNNINRLKKGFVLRIDDPAMITAMNKAEAAREVSRQTREWQDYRAAVAARASQRQAVGATEEPGTEVAAAKSEPKLELVAPAGKAAEPAAPGASTESLEQDLMLALESSAAQRKENEELQNRVQGLEEQLQDMQRLLSLKDADLAALQQQLRKQGAAVSLPSETAIAQTPPAAEAPVPPQEAPAAAATEEPPAAEPKPAPAAKPAPKRPVPPSVPVEEPGIIGMILGDTLMLTAVGGTLLLILVLVLVMIRRRSAGGFQESILSGRISSIMSEKAEAGGSETSFLSDLAVSGMGGGAIHADEGEVDPLTEADVFMAYGRHQQAEEVLNKALEKNPERVELTAKLLEVYYNLRDADRFAALSEENEESLKADAAMWARVTAMGQELMPENPLFEVSEGAEAETATAPSVKPEPISEDVLDIGLDLDELTAEMESEGAGSDLGLDLGLDFGDLEEEGKPATGAGEEGAEGPYEFDLDLGEEETGEEAAHEFELDLGPETAEEPAAEEEFGFELETGEMGEAAGQPVAEEPLDFGLETGAAETAMEEGAGLDLGDLEDFDFGELGLETGAEEGAPSVETAAEEVSLDMSELESPAEELEQIGNLGGFDDLGDLDEEGLLSDSEEIATKLDLAQAYIEMGDNEGARSMLEEVAEAGNDEQKQQAQELLQKV